MVAPGAADAKAAPFAGHRARRRGRAQARVLDAPTRRASFPSSRSLRRSSSTRTRRSCASSTKAWLDGLERSRKDASNIARRLANKEALPLAAGVGGAPEAISLLERLGQIEPAGLAQQRALIGATATGPVTLESLAQRTWMLARAGGLTTSAAPSPLPIDERIAAVDRAGAAAEARARGRCAARPTRARSRRFPTGTTPLVVYRAVDPQSDAASVAAQIGFLAGVFEHAAFRVTAKGGEKAARAIAAQARERFELPPRA